MKNEVLEPGVCDKCGRKIDDPCNSVALLLITKAIKNPIPYLAGLDRHLYPSDQCPGSPSRVKLIEDGDLKFVEAFNELREKYKT